MKSIRIGSGAGYAGDRWEPALELIETSSLDYIAFECLAERTIALGQLERLRDPDKGYNPFMEDRWRAVLGPAKARGVKIVTNMGAANPLAAAQRTVALARELGLPPIKVAVVLGDDVLYAVQASPDLVMMETGEPVSTLGNSIIAANAYLGAEPIRDALATGADVVITGRVADPSLFLAAMMHGLGWQAGDFEKMAIGTTIGHLLECAGQVTGGYFADPGVKDVSGLDRLGFPFATVQADGRAVISKPAGSGGAVTAATCTEQIFYECGNPAAYITPDCVADFTGLRFEETAPDHVSVSGAKASVRTGTLKTSVCYRAGHIGEGHVGYAGPNALARAELAASIVRSRLAQRKLDLDELRVDLIGVNSLHGAASTPQGEPYEVRLRVAARSNNRRHAEYVAQETQSLLTNGPYGGGGDFMQVRDLVGVRSVLLPREAVTPSITVLTS
ncbi:MAG: acyclic terpene utilization AtuA family protein [Beijerinckiaceae bacterium]